MTERALEAAWPYVISFAVAVAWFCLLRQTFPVPASPLLGAALTATAVLVGFLATAKAILLSIAPSEIFKRLKASKFMEPLFRYLFEAVWFGVAFLVYSVVGFFIDKPSGTLVNWYPPIWVFLGALTVFLYARITRLLFLLLSQV